MVFVAGSIYVIGGRDATGAPTKTVFVLSPDGQTGAARRVEHRGCAGPAGRPKRRRGRDHAGWPAARRRPERRRAGRHDLQDAARLDQGALGAWSQEQALNTPQADATAALVGDYLWLYGGSDANGPTGTIQRGAFGQAAAEGLPANPDVGKLIRWDVNASANLPVARTNASGWAANGAIYLAGGNDGAGPRSELYWAVPTTAGDMPEWKHLDVSDLPAPASRARPAVHQRPEAVLDRRQDRRPAGPRRPASGPTPRLSARSSSSAWSGRRCPA